MHISAMPPGEVPSKTVAGCRSAAWASSQAKPALAAIMPSVPTATLASQRGAARANSGVKRVPRATPMASCPALLASRGSAESCTPDAVSSMVAPSAPSTQGLGVPSRHNKAMPAALAASSTARPAGCTFCTAGRVVSLPWMPADWMATGISTTTSSTRSECAAATRSTWPWCFSARMDISEAPPMAAAKKAVARSPPLWCSSQR